MSQVEVAAAAGVITYLAQRGEHSRIHENIARKVALPAETITVLSGLLPENRLSRIVGRVGLVTTVLCFAAVALTDIHFIEFLKSDRPLSKMELQTLGKNWWQDTTRHLRI